ncbi:hypothetical protein [Geothrix sp. 21YS21S-2]|uniref:hypothetical protein n=1 Tax=Geothrix sp. 21YS21S-2 TaxID=3068893 RepID=UPI0027B9774A|nr:hypothetical protein [Geothrix sp. 21YS21S-2]
MSRNRRMTGIAIALAAGGSILLGGQGDWAPWRAKVIAQTRGNAVAMAFTQRITADGGEGLGYFTYLAGYPGPMFKDGAESPETRAYFTFRFKRDGLPSVVPQGAQLVMQQKATWTIWYHENPGARFDEADSFDRGVKIGEITATLVQISVDMRTFMVPTGAPPPAPALVPVPLAVTWASSFDDLQTWSGRFHGPDGHAYVFGAEGDRTRWEGPALTDATGFGTATTQVIQISRAWD